MKALFINKTVDNSGDMWIKDSLKTGNWPLSVFEMYKRDARGGICQTEVMSREKGNRGEDVACAILTKLGFAIIERNYYSKWGEIDIIAKKQGLIHLIEVKTSYGSYNPADNFHSKKRRRFLKTAKSYCFMNNIGPDNVQIDLALVHMPNRVFRLIEHPQA